MLPLNVIIMIILLLLLSVLWLLLLLLLTQHNKGQKKNKTKHNLTKWNKERKLALAIHNRGMVGGQPSHIWALLARENVVRELSCRET